MVPAKRMGRMTDHQRNQGLQIFVSNGLSILNNVQDRACMKVDKRFTLEDVRVRFRNRERTQSPTNEIKFQNQIEALRQRTIAKLQTGKTPDRSHTIVPSVFESQGQDLQEA